ncbi:sugar porter family MFS transporter [Saccharopolyspora mangrovi]|uniref:Sugar porter family MFS transporter n=1 Tax=Saccharopolyspora mangrovi TaxID=3082379 RepID=A0ABU6ALK5_9PSEU|nr:sugar porter family MFS transporter [Saccharopolyspora sp. S2-29]MEB3372426.1 sugar porter family MFS transporter [Saccharopolyspora sp. S2-29]
MAHTVSARSGSAEGSTKPFVRIITAVATLGALLFGYDTGVISGALPFMTLGPERGGLGLTPVTEGIVTSSLVFGAAFGAVFGGRLSDWHGRRRNILTLAVVFFIGALGTALAPNIETMVLFRIVLGLAVGGASATVPMFIAELAPAHRRAQLVTHNELMIVTGQLVAYTSNAAIANFWPSDEAWRYMLGLATIPAVLLWFGMLFLPESPRWYATKGRFDEALVVLGKIREPAEAERELAEIRRCAPDAGQAHRKEWTNLRTPWIRRLVIIGAVLGISVQLTGVNTIMYFAPTILQTTGLGTEASITASIANGVVSVVATFIGISLLGRIGRRPIIITGQVGVTISLALLGVCFLLPESTFRSFAVMAFMLIFLFFMQSMIATVWWLMMAEMFPLRFRGFAMGIAIFAQWISNGTVALTFPMLISALGGNTFFILALINSATIVFLTKFLPETGGKTLEELEEQFQATSPPPSK